MPNTPGQQGIRRNTFAQSSGEHPLFGGRDNRARDESTDLRQAIAENARDADDAQRVEPSSYPRELVAIYDEPFYLALPNEPQVGIKLYRIRNEPDDNRPVLCGDMVHFEWDGVQSRAVITSIDGLTPNGKLYRFNFLVVG